jgi:hypothetical protein
MFSFNKFSKKRSEIWARRRVLWAERDSSSQRERLRSKKKPVQSKTELNSKRTSSGGEGESGLE